MARARWLIAPAALVALAGCGSSTDSTTAASDATTAASAARGAATTTSAVAPGAPAVIHLARSASGDSETASDTPLPAEGDAGNGSDGQVEPMPIQPSIVTYVTAGDLPALGGSGPSWRLASGAKPDTAQIARVAHALGVEGEVTRLPADQGGGWIVGSITTGPSLQVNDDGLLSWWYNPAASAAPEPAKEPASSAAGVPESSGDGSTVSAGAAPDSQPPADVPTKDEATARARELLTAMGLDPGGYQFDSYADAWGANVTAWQLLEGHRSPLSTNFGFGDHGTLTWGGGNLATPQRGPDYPLIGTAAALARLNDQQVGWLTISGGGSGPARDVASGSAADGSVGSGDTSGTAPPQMMPSAGAPQATAGTTAHAPGPADRAPEPPPPSGASEGCPDPVPDVKVPNPGPDLPVASGTDQPIAPDTPCVPITVHTEPTRVTVTLTGVANDLSTVSDQAGNVWILPAYTFHDDSGATYTVLSVADRYLDLAGG